MQRKPPKTRKNVTLVKGWIDETLPSFLSQQNKQIAFSHIDTDIYETCKVILTNCRQYFTKGAIILFDELHSHTGWKQHEYKALTE
jgi:hypothetical protein